MGLAGPAHGGVRGHRPGVEAQAAAAADLLGRVGEAAVASPGGTGAALSQLGARPFEAEAALKVAVPPAEAPAALDQLRRGSVHATGGFSVHAHAATGVLWLASGTRRGRPPARPPLGPQAGRWIAETREALAAGGLVVVKAPPHLKRRSTSGRRPETPSR